MDEHADMDHEFRGGVMDGCSFKFAFQFLVSLSEA